jgi:hypothetical protein
MKKLVFLVAVLFGTVTASAQYSAPVKVVVQNRTPYNVYFAPRYHLAFYDNNNDHTFFGINHEDLGWIVPNNPNDPDLVYLHRDLNYQQEGLFEPVLSGGQTRTYYNPSQYGYPFVPNGSYSTFNTTDNGSSVMEGYQNNPVFIRKYMRLDWIRFSMSASTQAASFYGGGIAHPVPTTGFTAVTPAPANTGSAAAVGPYNEMMIPYWSSTASFSYNGTTINVLWTATTYVPGQVQTVNIVFY